MDEAVPHPAKLVRQGRFHGRLLSLVVSLPAPDYESAVHRRVILAEVVADCRVRDVQLPRGILGQSVRIPASIACRDGMWNEVSIDPVHLVARSSDGAPSPAR